jgi:hypothetical protein
MMAPCSAELRRRQIFCRRENLFKKLASGYVKESAKNAPKPFLSKLMQNYFRNLEYELACISAAFIRAPCGNLRSFLLNCAGGPLRGADHHLIHQVQRPGANPTTFEFTSTTPAL